MPNEMQELQEFFSFIYGEAEGYAYLALKAPNSADFQQKFYEYPKDLHKLTQDSITYRDNFEVYYAPALFTSTSGEKEAVKGANVFWVDWDGNAPTEVPPGVPPPTLRVQSSIPGHEHWYWKADQFVGPFDLERVNRALAYKFDADISCWAANKILRPINTFNHKRGAPVGVVNSDYSGTVSLDVFAALPDPPSLVEVALPEELPEVADVIRKYKIPDEAWTLFNKGRPQGERSEGLMALGYYMAEVGMENDEIFAVLINADMRWGKFKERDDQLQRIQEIVTVAREKYPFGDGTSLIPVIKGSGLLTFLKTEYKFEWVWDGYLQKNGYFMLTGPSGVGKTQFSLNAGMNMALGMPFLERKTAAPKRIGMLSLEMGGPDLQFFLQKQAEFFNSDQLATLQENFIVAPIGEPIYMDLQEGQERVEDWIKDNELDGIIIDSLGSAMAGDVSSETSVKSLMAWNDNIRQRLDVFTWFIHHHRKATGDNKKPNKLQDVYGSMYLTARATSVVCLWNVGLAGNLQVLPLKMRLSPDKDPFTIYRDNSLIFNKKSDGITKPSVESTGENEVEDTEIVLDTGQTPGSGFGKGI